MSDSLPRLIVLAIGGSIAPPVLLLLLLTILFLSSHGPLTNAGALTLGYFTTCAVIGHSGLLLLFGGAKSTVSTVERIISVTVGALLIVLGLRSLLDSSDPDTSPPGWMESKMGVRPCKTRAKLGNGGRRKLKG